MGDIFSAFSDIFGDIFGGARPGGGRGPARGSDIEVRLSLTLAEAFTGVSKGVKILRRAPCTRMWRDGRGGRHGCRACQHCGGRGQVMHSQGFLMISTTCPVCRGEGRVVRKPCDSCDGTGLDHPGRGAGGGTCRRGSRTVRHSSVGRGEAAPQGGRHGNLYVILRVQGDERFKRDGANLHAEVAVSFPQLALGDTVEVPTLDGEGALDIPPGTQPGETVVLRGRGMPRLDGRGRGDIVAHVKLVVPSSMSEEEEAHLRAYAAVRRPARQPRTGRLLQAQAEEVAWRAKISREPSGGVIIRSHVPLRASRRWAYS